MPPETLDAKLCCSAHSTSDREMRLLHSVLAVTGKAVVACSYGLPEGGRCVWLGLWWIDRKQQKKEGGGWVEMTPWHIRPTSQCELCSAVMSKGSCMWTQLCRNTLKLSAINHRQSSSLLWLWFHFKHPFSLFKFHLHSICFSNQDYENNMIARAPVVSLTSALWLKIRLAQHCRSVEHIMINRTQNE